MPQLTEKQEGIEYLLDDVTMKIVDILLDNPAVPYNKSQLAEAADVSRDALYRRWDALIKYDILKQSEVGAKGTYWELNEDSDVVEAIARILHRS